MLGGIGGRRRREQQRMRWLDGITDSMDMSLAQNRNRLTAIESRPVVAKGVGKRKKTDWEFEINRCKLLHT